MWLLEKRMHIEKKKLKVNYRQKPLMKIFRDHL